ncbi:MAG: dihydrodipicolinate synthase family protein [Candidatus Bathyarchaeia archaeon]
MALKLHGVCAILATPFDSQKRLDERSLRALVDFELRAGVHGITILGILGEVLRLSDAELREITRIVVDEVRGRVPVISGTGATGTDLAIMYSKEAEELKADALMIAPPRLAKPNDDALVKYYKDIANEVTIPIVIQDEPTTYAVHMSPKLIAQLSEIEHLEYLKLEDPPTPTKVSQIRNLIGDKLGIFGGLGGLYAFEELARGAVGVMTGFAYPEILVNVYEAFSQGRRNEARSLFYQAMPLIRYEAQPTINVAIRKEIFKRRGIIKDSTLREPAGKLDSDNLKELDELISTLDSTLNLESKKIVATTKQTPITPNRKTRT